MEAEEERLMLLDGKTPGLREQMRAVFEVTGALRSAGSFLLSQIGKCWKVEGVDACEKEENQS